MTPQIAESPHRRTKSCRLTEASKSLGKEIKENRSKRANNKVAASTMEGYHRGDASSPLTIDSKSSSDSEGDTQPLHVASFTKLRIASPPPTHQQRIPVGTRVYKYFPTKKKCLWGRVILYNPITEYRVRYEDKVATVENVPQAEMEYIVAAAADTFKSQEHATDTQANIRGVKWRSG